VAAGSAGGGSYRTMLTSSWKLVDTNGGRPARHSYRQQPSAYRSEHAEWHLKHPPTHTLLRGSRSMGIWVSGSMGVWFSGSMGVWVYGGLGL
jgi:hypothetical protein